MRSETNSELIPAGRKFEFESCKHLKTKYDSEFSNEKFVQRGFFYFELVRLTDFSGLSSLLFSLLSSLFSSLFLCLLSLSLSPCVVCDVVLCYGVCCCVAVGVVVVCVCVAVGGL